MIYINIRIKKIILLFVSSLIFASCDNKKNEVYKNQSDSFPKYLISMNDSLYDYMKDSPVDFNINKNRDTIHYEDFSDSEKTLIFQKLHFNDYGFRSNKILISFERAEETNGINFSAEISNYDFLYIKYYDNDEINILKIKLEKEEKRLFKILLSNLNQYKQEYEEKNKEPLSGEKLLIIYNYKNVNHLISGDLFSMSEQMKVLISMIFIDINKYSKEYSTTTFDDLPSHEILEYYNKKMKIGGYIPEPVPIP